MRMQLLPLLMAPLVSRIYASDEMCATSPGEAAGVSSYGSFISPRENTTSLSMGATVNISWATDFETSTLLLMDGCENDSLTKTLVTGTTRKYFEWTVATASTNESEVFLFQVVDGGGSASSGSSGDGTVNNNDNNNNGGGTINNNNVNNSGSGSNNTAIASSNSVGGDANAIAVARDEIAIGYSRSGKRASKSFLSSSFYISGTSDLLSASGTESSIVASTIILSGTPTAGTAASSQPSSGISEGAIIGVASVFGIGLLVLVPIAFIMWRKAKTRSAPPVQGKHGSEDSLGPEALVNGPILAPELKVLGRNMNQRCELETPGGEARQQRTGGEQILPEVVHEV